MPQLTVVGSVNLDLVARSARLPRVGETLTDATFARYPGGKGANQAVAAARLGAETRLVGAVGADLAEQVLRGAALADDLEALAGEQAGDSLAQQDRVVGEDDADGRLGVVRIGVLGIDATDCRRRAA